MPQPREAPTPPPIGIEPAVQYPPPPPPPGRVEGSLTAKESVFIAEEADVNAVIRAAIVTVAGNVHGSVHCAERFEILPRGKVAGDIHAPAIAIHDGAVVAGEISMSPSNDTRASLPPA